MEEKKKKRFATQHNGGHSEFCVRTEPFDISHIGSTRVKHTRRNLLRQRKSAKMYEVSNKKMFVSTHGDQKMPPPRVNRVHLIRRTLSNDEECYTTDVFSIAASRTLSTSAMVLESKLRRTVGFSAQGTATRRDLDVPWSRRHRVMASTGGCCWL